MSARNEQHMLNYWPVIKITIRKTVLRYNEIPTRINDRIIRLFDVTKYTTGAVSVKWIIGVPTVYGAKSIVQSLNPFFAKVFVTILFHFK